MSLFRQEVIAHRARRSYGEIRLGTNRGLAVLAPIAFLTAVFIAAILIFGTYTRKHEIAGTLIPEKGLTKIVSPFSGRVAQRLVAEGQVVRVGEPLFVLSGERDTTLGPTRRNAKAQVDVRREILTEQLSRSERNLHSIRSMTKSRLDGLAAEARKLDEEIELQRNRLPIAEEIDQRYRKLLSENYISSAAASQKQDDLLIQKSLLKSLERARLSINREQRNLEADNSALLVKEFNEIDEIKRGLSLSTQQSIELEADREIVLRAPYDAIVSMVSAELDEPVEANRALAVIYPADSKLQAIAYAPSRSIGFVKNGQTVNVRYQTYPYQKFGQHAGLVSSISGSPSLNREGDLQRTLDEPAYRIVVQLNSQSIKTYGVNQGLKPGMRFDASINLEKRTLLEWILDPLFSITGKWN